MLKIPDGYAPFTGRVVVTGRGVMDNDRPDLFYAQVSMGGVRVLDADVVSAAKSTYRAEFAVDQRFAVDNEGIPVTARVVAHDDRTATVNIGLTCRRTAHTYQRWQLRTYERIREAYALLEREYKEAVDQAGLDQATLTEITGRPSAMNRQIERDELKKWAIKTLRVIPFDFDAIVDEGGIAEIDPIASDHQAPAVRFYEEAFEWPQISYFLYPYFWGRRSAWAARSNVRVPGDPLHETFLRSGSARVIVPVTPGYEDRVLQFLESDPSLPEAERIPPPTDEMPPGTQFPDLWLELLLNCREELALGDGTLAVTHGSAEATLNGSQWQPNGRDVGRELFIAGATYEVAASDAGTLTLDRPYEGESNPAAKYATGSVPFGSSWLARIPTALVVLSNATADDVFES